MPGIDGLNELESEAVDDSHALEQSSQQPENGSALAVGS